MKKTGGPCAPPPPRPGLGLATRLRAVLLASPVSPSFRPRRPSLLAAPAWLSSWPARLCPQAWGQPCPPDASAPASNPRSGMGSGDHSSLGPETLGRLLPLPSTSCWWLPASGHQGLGSLSNCQPHAIGTSRWAFPITPPQQLLGSTARPRLREGMGLCRPGGPSCPASTCFYCPPHGGSQDPGAWKEAVPQEPKKVSTSIIGALEPYHQASDGAASARPPAPRGRPGGASRWRCAVCSHLGQQGPLLTCRSLSHPYTAHSSR